MTNNAGGTLSVVGGGSLGIKGTVANNGLFQVMNTDVSITGNLTNNGGTMTISGSPTNTVTIGGTYFGNDTYVGSGGSLVAHAVVNHGSFTQTAGQATMLGLSGVGKTLIGGGNGTALVSVASFAQTAVTINAGGTLLVRRAEPRVTNTVNALSITGNGLLDLANHALLLDNSATPETTVRQYLKND
jgi:hypothetical protein